ncbi:glycosyltransferase family 4 protein [Mesorhizobium sp. RP14(2022)]|uniref:Glycosyltransferase family 4 protein n=2 Tax=Mesorhizobium liriopis TaxID=2953882 RepID=A0ABT1C6U2_9HYPH|nr:glycosyltransferase family 4 protein [Mesorhizobium liriopis]MCO6049891.1 glycosyltransferase family 4 protein [Mesorhizobium liriopis]
MGAVEVVAPNFKKRLSGVTSTIVQLVPVQARDYRIVTLGPGLPDSLPHMRWWQVPALLLKPRRRLARIWHARRNIEMVGGLVLKHLFRAPLKLVFTSAAQRAHKPFTKWLIRRMDAVIATSARSGSYLEVPHDVVMHGVDLAVFHPPAEGERGVSDLPGRYLVGCFGRVRHSKGTDLFVDAMIALLPSHPEWSALITGRATAEHQSFQNELEQRIAKAGLSDRIRFLGEVPEVASWYRRVHLYVAPSRNEGFGLTPLEAMASGAAVVATDAGSYAELVVPGETGAVVSAGEERVLIDAIRPYLNDPELCERHGQAGLAVVRERFPLDSEAAGVARVYERLFRDGAR